MLLSGSKSKPHTFSISIPILISIWIDRRDLHAIALLAHPYLFDIIPFE
jgi:hypothetical protein